MYQNRWLEENRPINQDGSTLMHPNWLASTGGYITNIKLLVTHIFWQDTNVKKASKEEIEQHKEILH